MELSQRAGVDRLKKFADITLIEKFASVFGLDPEVVETEKSFNTVMMFHHKWKEELEYQDRYDEIKKMEQNIENALNKNQNNDTN